MSDDGPRTVRVRAHAEAIQPLKTPSLHQADWGGPSFHDWDPREGLNPFVCADADAAAAEEASVRAVEVATAAAEEDEDAAAVVVAVPSV